MREFDIEVNGLTVHVKEESNAKFLVTVPLGSKRMQCDPVTGKCSFGEPFNGCSCEPQDCPERVEQWMKSHDVEMEKLYDIKPEQRDLTFLKARLAQRCATNHSNPRQATSKENNPEDAATVVSRLKLRQPFPPSLTPLQRLRRQLAATKPLRALSLPKSLQNERSKQIVRELKRRQGETPPMKPEKWEKREATITGGLFEKIEYSKPADGWKDWRKRIQLESMRD